MINKFKFNYFNNFSLLLCVLINIKTFSSTVPVNTGLSKENVEKILELYAGIDTNIDITTLNAKLKTIHGEENATTAKKAAKIESAQELESALTMILQSKKYMASKKEKESFWGQYQRYIPYALIIMGVLSIIANISILFKKHSCSNNSSNNEGKCCNCGGPNRSSRNSDDGY